MTVVVAYKYASNPQDASVSADGTVDWSRAKAAISDYDPVAVQLGREIAQAKGTEVVGVSVGTEAVGGSMAKKATLSRGLDRAIVVADDDTRAWNPTKVASALAGMIRTLDGVDIVITGDSSVDEGARMMSALIAGYLGWPCFQEVAGVEATADAHVITQMVRGGTRQIEVKGPVVIAATSDAVETKVPSMKEVLAAGKKPLDVVAASDLQLAEAELAITSTAKPARRSRKGQMFSGPDAPDQLIAALRADGVL